MVRVGRLELPASCSQTCVGTFKRHSAALFGPFRRSGNSSLTLFCPACFKQNFLLLGWVWDWILYIKRSAVRGDGDNGPDHRRGGAENAPHKQRIAPNQPGRSSHIRSIAQKFPHFIMPIHKRLKVLLKAGLHHIRLHNLRHTLWS